MSSRSSSCFGTLILILISLVLIRFALPQLWVLLIGLFSTALYASAALFIIMVCVFGYLIFKNLQGNKQKQQETHYAKVTRVETLYRSIVDRLQRDMIANRVSAEELLQSELLIGQPLKDIKLDLIRLKDFVSSKNEKILSQQLRDYRQQLQQSSDESVKQVVRENLRLIEEKKQRMAAAVEEIRQKEASVDLIYNSLLKADENLNLGKPVRHLFPSDLYQRFGLPAPEDIEPLPPLKDKSSATE